MSVPSTSLAAFKTVPTASLEERVLEVIESFGTRGCTYEEVKRAMPTLSHSSVTARFKPLEDKGLIVRDGDTRPGTSGREQQVMRGVAYAKTKPKVAAPKPIKRSGFLNGVMFAARIVLAAPDMTAAKKGLRDETMKLAGKSAAKKKGKKP